VSQGGRVPPIGPDATVVEIAAATGSLCSMPQGHSTRRLLLWPSLLTLAISLARLVLEVQGSVSTASGGRLLPLGITWGIFVFGGWFGRRLSLQNDTPRVRLGWLWALLALLAAIGTAVSGFRPLVGADTSEATFAQLRTAVLTTAIVTSLAAAAMFAVWPRLAWTLLLYGLGARATVLASTWLAKHQGWDTHYTKFGPSGIEQETMAATMASAGIAQLGFWVPFTIVGGTLCGCLLARRSR
jgi:hypothetical protein